MKVLGQHHLPKVLETAIALDEPALLIPGVGRAVVLMAFEVVMPPANAVGVVDAAPAEVPGVVGPERIETAMAVILV
ncbi:MAG: hypothetical protein ACYC6Y_24830, partial [Thermoguttaceae bacterium]